MCISLYFIVLSYIVESEGYSIDVWGGGGAWYQSKGADDNRNVTQTAGLFWKVHTRSISPGLFGVSQRNFNTWIDGMPCSSNEVYVALLLS